MPRTLFELSIRELTREFAERNFSAYAKPRLAGVGPILIDLRDLLFYNENVGPDDLDLNGRYAVCMIKKIGMGRRAQMLVSLVGDDQAVQPPVKLFQAVAAYAAGLKIVEFSRDCPQGVNEFSMSLFV